MKYCRVVCLVGFTDKDINDWSEHADVTFNVARAGLHDPDNNIYLLDHCEFPVITEEEADKLKYSVITPEGGV